MLTFSRVHLSLTVEGRERQRVAAVDARGPEDPTTDSIPAVQPEAEAEPEPAAAGGGRLFARDRAPEAGPEPEPEPAGARTADGHAGGEAGNSGPEPKQD